MTRTLLVDLDNTLLSNDMDTFVPAYLRALSLHMVEYTEPAVLAKALMSATNVMARNDHPGRTLMETFDALFYPALGLEKAQVQGHLDAFYTDKFPGLKSLTDVRPAAVALVKDALQADYRVGVATNPLFPRMAIEHRLTWAGLSPQETPFSLVPSYDTFHFAKPNPAFFTEFLAQMGWPEGPLLMVGDDLQMDILSAMQIGMPAYYISHDSNAWTGDGPAPQRGALEDLWNWLQETSDEALQPKMDNPQAFLAMLRSTPAALGTISSHLMPEAWFWQEAEGEWSLTEILCHLRDVESEVNLPRIRKVMQEDNPFLLGIDTDAWAKERNYQGQDGRLALTEFTQVRLESLTLLAGLPPEGWGRSTRHAIFGPTSLQELVRIIADHDRLHVRQVHRIVQRKPPSPG